MDAMLVMPKTLQEAVTYFSDQERAHAYAVALRWPDGHVTCPRCGSEDHSLTKSFVRVKAKDAAGNKIEAKRPRWVWSCKPCQKQFTVRVNTVMEDSPLGLDKWLIAMWALANCRNGISSYELSRTLGITQKASWHVLHRIRLAMHDDYSTKLGGKSGEVESDEAYLGGRGENMHREKRIRLGGNDRSYGKVVVMALLEREGQVRAGIIPDTSRVTLQSTVRKHVAPGTRLYTDQQVSYEGLNADYVHEVVNHSRRYVHGRVHTNGLENFWSLLKRCIAGTYVSVEPFHLFRYLDEQSFRFNQRKDEDKKPKSDLERFKSLLAKVEGKRLTYNRLTNREGEIRS